MINYAELKADCTLEIDVFKIHIRPKNVHNVMKIKPKIQKV